MRIMRFLMGAYMRLCLSRFKSWVFHVLNCKRDFSRNESQLMERLSHELRTSLTGIVGYSEFVESTSAEPMVNFTAKIIRESSQNLARADLPPARRTKVMAVSPQILENCGYEDHTIYR
jgi:hypothetical protein